MAHARACAGCGCPLPPQQGTKPRKWCSTRCTRWAQRNPGIPTPPRRLCECGTQITAGEHDQCSKCRVKAKPPQEKTCSHCGEQFLAGRADARYCTNRCRNHAREARTATEIVACKNCGDGFERIRAGAKKRVQVYCSKHCMAVARSRRCVDCTVRTVAPGTTRCEACAARSRWEREMSRLIGKWLMRPVSTAKPPRTTTCEHCGATFKTPQPAQRFCSRQCAHRHHGHASKARRRERIKKQHVAPVYRRRIAERDEWRCKLCGKKVRRDAKVPHPLAPTLDHVVPIALGGKHEPSNVQLAHFRCNALKGVDARDEQLMLIG